VAGLAVAGVVVAAIWFPIAYALGKRYESARDGAPIAPAASPAPAPGK
jgi:hypothetical protein